MLFNNQLKGPQIILGKKCLSIKLVVDGVLEVSRLTPGPLLCDIFFPPKSDGVQNHRDDFGKGS